MRFDVDKMRDPKAGSINAGESVWAYLDRCGKPECGPVRAHWNALVDLVPEELSEEYKTRLLARDESTVYGAVAELALLESLRNAGIDCGLVGSSESGSRPDIEVRVNSQPACQLEAAVRLGSSGESKAEEDLYLFLHETAPLVADPCIRLWLHEVEQTSATPSRKAFAAWLDQHSDLLDTELLYVDQSAGWTLALTIIRPNGAETKPRRLHYAGPTTAAFSNAPESLDAVLGRKRRQHTGEGVPIVTALAWADFKNKPDLSELGSYLARLAARRGRDVELVWCGSCHPWTVEVLQPVLLHTSESLPNHLRWWPLEVKQIGRRESGVQPA